MKSKVNVFAHLRRLAAALSLLAMTAVFFVPAAARWCGWLPRLQLVPAILAGAVLEIAVLALSVLLFGRLYCSVVCPLGILQDLIRTGRRRCLPRVDAASSPRQNKNQPPRVDAASSPRQNKNHAVSSGRGGDAASTRKPILRYAILALFLLAIPFGLTGLVEPYGIFGRFLAAGIRRAGEPAVVTVVWVWGLVLFILAMTFVRARWWCNRICPVGTFLGLFSRFALVRVRIDSAACVKCGACAKRCDKGALAVRADRSIAFDASSCVACGNCFGACPKGALAVLPRGK